MAPPQQRVLDKFQPHDAALLKAERCADKITPDKDGAQEFIRPGDRDFQDKACDDTGSGH